ncbi:class I SAM-dependent methyltransferase [Methylobacterium sp. WL122]|nr:class I SAM-dependent methyltransferase [Methylobacterium sp. WL122]
MTDPNSNENRLKRFVGPINNDSTILEIGALNKPTINQSYSKVKYADFADQKTLQSLYSKYDGFDTSKIIAVDYVISDGDYVQSIRKIDPDITFDLIIGSHVAEHIPDFLGWLHQMEQLLKPGGILSLIMPDKRFTFDLLKTETEASEWLSAYEEKLKRPSANQIYKHIKDHINLEDLWLWTIPSEGKILMRAHTEHEAWALASSTTISNNYFDSHCSIMTPRSFYNNLMRLDKIGLIPLELQSLEDTCEGAIDFFVRLQKSNNSSKKPIDIYIPKINQDAPYQLGIFSESSVVVYPVKSDTQERRS